MRRQVVLPVDLLSTAYRRDGGGRMSDYEILMIVLTFLTLLLMASKKN